MNAPVVIYVNGSSSDTVTAPRAMSSSDAASVLAGSDPHAIAKAFPEKWKRLVRSICATPIQVQHVFQVSERTAYRWWSGKGGANGAHVLTAVQTNPALTHQLLFAEAV